MRNLLALNGNLESPVILEISVLCKIAKFDSYHKMLLETMNIP